MRVEVADLLAAFTDRFLSGISPAWRRAAVAAPRHLFAPARAWCGPEVAVWETERDQRC